MSREIIKYHIEYSNETKIKASELYLADLEKQVEKLKKNKDLFSYDAYRYAYMRLYAQIGNYKKQIKKLKGEK